MTKLLPITIHPNPSLRQKSKEIETTEIAKKEFQQWLLDLGKTMIKEDGIGLAAPQVGEPIRVIAVQNKNKTIFIINPVINKRSWAKEWDQEGCLSVPKTYGDVQRHKKISFSYWDQEGKKQKSQAQKLFARVIQHEIDHLDGILFIDKAKNIQSHGTSTL